MVVFTETSNANLYILICIDERIKKNIDNFLFKLSFCVVEWYCTRWWKYTRRRYSRDTLFAEHIKEYAVTRKRHSASNRQRCENAILIRLHVCNAISNNLVYAAYSAQSELFNRVIVLWRFTCFRVLTGEIACAYVLSAVSKPNTLFGIRTVRYLQINISYIYSALLLILRNWSWFVWSTKCAAYEYCNN